VEFSEVIRRRKMVRSFQDRPLPPGTADRLLKAANRAPSAGFCQGYRFLVLEGAEEAAPLWDIAYALSTSDHTTADDSAEQVDALKRAPLVIIPLACKNIYLDRYAGPNKRLARDESVHPIPYWYIDTGFTALLTLLAVVDEGLGAVLFGIGGPAEIEDFRIRFGVPPEWDPIGAIAIGYPDPDTDPVPPARPGDRKPLAELVHHGHW